MDSLKEALERHLFKLYHTIALTFTEEGFDSTCAQLRDLAYSYTTKGKCDDVSIAGFIDMTALKQTAAIWKSQIADEETEKRQKKESSIKTTPSAAPGGKPAPISVKTINFGIAGALGGLVGEVVSEVFRLNGQEYGTFLSSVINVDAWASLIIPSLNYLINTFFFHNFLLMDLSWL